MDKLIPIPSRGLLTERDIDKPPILDIHSLGIDFGGLHAVENFTLVMGRTEITGLIGPNGAGKTTVFNLITNVYQPTRGVILLDGIDTKGKRTYQISQMGVARTFQNIRLFGNLTVEENVAYGLKARKLPKLEIVRALATNPKLLLLDEPAAGMNPAETAELMGNIRKIRDTFQIAIMLIEHDMSLVMGICEGIAVLNYGKIIAKGSPEEIKNNPVVIEAYLGKKEA